MTRVVLAVVLLLCAASAAQAHWSDVRFRNLTAEYRGEGFFDFSVQLVNTEGETNGANVSFEVENTTEKSNYCPQHVSLSSFEKRILKCPWVGVSPGVYTLIFQSERTRLEVLPNQAGSAMVTAAPAVASPAPTHRQPGFEVPWVLVAIGAALALLQGRRR